LMRRSSSSWSIATCRPMTRPKPRITWARRAWRLSPRSKGHSRTPR
jgi:hypothetical protein